MGCDGGTIPTRDELVTTKKKKEKKDRVANRHYQWTRCRITNEGLRRPIVACRKGYLYNKESVLEYLLKKKDSRPRHFRHIKKMKDVKELNLTDNQSYVEFTKNDGERNGNNSFPFICPISGIEMNGYHRFFYYRKCGCVQSERANEMLKNFPHHCDKISEKMKEGNDLIELNKEEDEKEVEKREKELSRKRKCEPSNNHQYKISNLSENMMKEIQKESSLKSSFPKESFNKIFRS
ncbi:hypothetical protein SNEBB_006155 [Seison nebaliae]|nr:hypothetical protein SNEBB_006155 [Seison nebaliae]